MAMQASVELKSVEVHDQTQFGHGWSVIFEVRIRNAFDFAVPVFVSATDADEKTLITVAYQRLHEVASALVQSLGTTP